MSDQPINQGSNGFHLFTVVTDGYGNLIAEDGEGRVIATCKGPSEVDDENSDAVAGLVREVWAKLNDPAFRADEQG